MQFSLALHIIGIVMWVGGLMILTRIMKDFSDTRNDKVAALGKRLFNSYVLGGLALTALTGLYQLLQRGAGFYFAQGWFHTKVTLVLVLLVVTIVTAVTLGRYQRGEAVSGKRFMMIHGVTGLILLIVTVITMLGRVS